MDTGYKCRSCSGANAGCGPTAGASAGSGCYTNIASGCDCASETCSDCSSETCTPTCPDCTGESAGLDRQDCLAWQAVFKGEYSLGGCLCEQPNTQTGTASPFFLDPCACSAITCSDGRITGMELRPDPDEFYEVEHIPGQFCQLTGLTRLDLHGLMGPLECECLQEGGWRQLNQLTYLDMSGFDLLGFEGDWLSNKLTHLNLQGNSEFPPEMKMWDFCSNQKELTYLNLRGRQADEPWHLESSIGSLSQLAYLDLHGTNLHGTIPTSTKDLGNLAFIDLSNNNCSGVIPALPFSQYSNCSLQASSGPTNSFWCPLPSNSDQCKNGPPSCTAPPTPPPTPVMYSCDSATGRCAAGPNGTQAPGECIATCKVVPPTPAPAPPSLLSQIWSWSRRVALS
jgi:hypothetical protein